MFRVAIAHSSKDDVQLMSELCDIWLDIPKYEVKPIHKELDEHTNLILFTGGSDVSPELYGETEHKRTRPDWRRDIDETRLWLKAKNLGIPCVGICRGSQFLCVMNGGKLHQHVDGHTLGEAGHIVNLTKTGSKILVNSYHHQALIPQGKFNIIATSIEVPYPEIVLWPETESIGFQYHPEWMKFNSEGRDLFLATVSDFLEDLGVI